MNVADQIKSFSQSPVKLSEVLSTYLSVDSNKIMGYLTESELEYVDLWADNNLLSIADMLDVIQRNLSSEVELKIKSDNEIDDQLLVNSQLSIKDGYNNYSLSLLWFLGE